MSGKGFLLVFHCPVVIAGFLLVFHRPGVIVELLLAPTVGAQDVVTLGEEAPPHQRHRALHTRETLAVPLALLKGDVLSSSQAGDRLGAAHTLLGVQIAEAVQAVGVVVAGGEALPGELASAADAQETLAVPRLLLIGHSARRDRLLAGGALVGELFLEAVHTEVCVVFGDEGLGADRLLTALTQEAGLMPTVPLILHLTRAWHDGLLAAAALGGVVVGVTLRTQQQLVFSSERFLHQGATALSTLKTLLVPVTILIRQVLAVAANRSGAALAAVGEQVLVALGAVLRVLLHDVLLPQQRVFAVVAVEAFVRHHGLVCSADEGGLRAPGSESAGDGDGGGV